nr:hypothetical protein [Mucilaginibacter lappiensis]
MYWVSALGKAGGDHTIGMYKAQLNKRWSSFAVKRPENWRIR